MSFKVSKNTLSVLVFFIFLFFNNKIINAQCTNVSLLNQNPVNAFVGPAANCANNTGGDPTSNTFSYSANTSCYDEVDVSITIIPDNPNTSGNPGFEGGDRVEITLTDDNGSTTTTINGSTYNGGNSNTFTATRTNPGDNLNIDVFIRIQGNNRTTNGGGCWERLRVTNVNVTGSDSTPPVVPTITDETFECSGTPITPTTIDGGCTTLISGTTTTIFPITTIGTTVVNWTFEDSCGNITTANQNVIIQDTSAPVTPTIADETFECSGTPTTPTTTDACDPATINGTTTTTFPITTLGTTVVTWTFTDASGNSTTVDQNVIVTSCVADLSLTKTVDNAIVKIGDTVIFTLKITNSGPESAFGVQVTDALPTGLTYDASNSVIPSGTTYNSVAYIWDLSGIEIANGQTMELKIGAIVGSSGIITNVSEVTQNNQSDPDSTPNNGN